MSGAGPVASRAQAPELFDKIGASGVAVRRALVEEPTRTYRFRNDEGASHAEGLVDLSDAVQAEPELGTESIESTVDYAVPSPGTTVLRFDEIELIDAEQPASGRSYEVFGCAQEQSVSTAATLNENSAMGVARRRGGTDVWGEQDETPLTESRVGDAFGQASAMAPSAPRHRWLVVLRIAAVVLVLVALGIAIGEVLWKHQSKSLASDLVREALQSARSEVFPQLYERLKNSSARGEGYDGYTALLAALSLVEHEAPREVRQPSDFGRLSSNRPRNTVERLAWAYLSLARGELVKAAQLLRQGAESSTYEAELWHARSRVAFAAHDLERARATSAKARKLAPENRRYLRHAARVSLASDRLQQAKAQLEQIPTQERSLDWHVDRLRLALARGSLANDAHAGVLKTLIERVEERGSARLKTWAHLLDAEFRGLRADPAGADAALAALPRDRWWGDEALELARATQLLIRGRSHEAKAIVRASARRELPHQDWPCLALWAGVLKRAQGEGTTSGQACAQDSALGRIARGLRAEAEANWPVAERAYAALHDAPRWVAYRDLRMQQVDALRGSWPESSRATNGTGGAAPALLRLASLVAASAFGDSERAEEAYGRLQPADADSPAGTLAAAALAVSRKQGQAALKRLPDPRASDALDSISGQTHRDGAATTGRSALLGPDSTAGDLLALDSISEGFITLLRLRALAFARDEVPDEERTAVPSHARAAIAAALHNPALGQQALLALWDRALTGPDPRLAFVLADGVREIEARGQELPSPIALELLELRLRTLVAEGAGSSGLPQAEASLGREPKSAVLAGAFAALALQAERFDMAQEALAKQQALAPSSTQARLGLARIAIVRGRLGAAEGLLERALPRSSHQEAIKTALRGMVQFEYGRLRGARHQFKKALQIDPRCGLAHWGLARLRKPSQEGRLESLRQAALSLPPYVEAWGRLAVELPARDEEACRWAKRYLAAAPAGYDARAVGARAKNCP